MQLPQLLRDGLTLRWGRKEDAAALAAFNLDIHSDDPEQPEHWLAHWTNDLTSGKHPTTAAEDFTIVENRSGEIVSSPVRARRAKSRV